MSDKNVGTPKKNSEIYATHDADIRDVRKT